MPYHEPPKANTEFPDINAFLEECFSTMKSKGHDYRQGSPDALKNFKLDALAMEIPMEKVWYIFAAKHWKAIQTFCAKGGQLESEPIEGRIKDVIVYLLLFYKLVQEMKEKPVDSPQPAVL